MNGRVPVELTGGTEFPRIGELSYEVRGTILREPDRAAQVFTLGPRVLVHMDSLPATGLEQPGSLISYHYRIDLPPEEDEELCLPARGAGRQRAGGEERGVPDAGRPDLCH